MLSIRRRFQGKNVLLTGATGFLGKVVLEKILRSIPESGTIFVMVRGRGLATAEQRLERDVLGSSIFDRLRSTEGSRFEDRVRGKIRIVDGDLSEEGLGLSAASQEELTPRVDLVVNCAALCTFREQLDLSLQANTLGAHRILKFAKDCGNVPLVHVSTCFVNSRNEGVIAEEVLPAGHTLDSIREGREPGFDIDGEITSMLQQCDARRSNTSAGENKAYGEENKENTNAVVEYGLETARKHGWWDGYAFSKSLGEQLVERDRGAVPVAIVRPAIIESSLRDPTPGWIDGIRMLDPLFTEGGKGYLLEFPGDRTTVVDLVPCDMVANAVLAAMPEPGSSGLTVYQVCSSGDNPITVGEMTDFGVEAFTKRPSRNRAGEPVVPKPPLFLSVVRFERRLRLRVRILQAVRRISRWLGMDARARWATMMLRLLGRLSEMADTYSHYLFSSPVFDSTNTRRLRESLSHDERGDFFFDVTEIDWRDYLVNTHIPALQRLTGDGGDPNRPSDDERRQVSA